MSNPFLQVSGDAKRALEEFSLAFREALAAAAAEAWAASIGFAYSSSAIKTTYPLPVSTAGYKLHTGDPVMRRLFARSLSMQTREWTDGVEEKLAKITAPDFIGWGEEPGNIAREGARLPNVIAAEVLEANDNLSFYKDEELSIDAGIPLFSDSHPVNVFDTSFGTFDNDHEYAAVNSTFMKETRARFRAKKAPNGKPAGRRFTDILAPAALEETIREFLESDLMYLATLAQGSNVNQLTNNLYKNAVNLIVSDELTQDDVFYCLDRNGPKPWIVQTSGAPEEITFDQSSDYYKQTLKVGVKYILRADVKAALPHAIERITLTG